jgi:hypothetical protein
MKKGIEKTKKGFLKLSTRGLQDNEQKKVLINRVSYICLKAN